MGKKWRKALKGILIQYHSICDHTNTQLLFPNEKFTLKMWNHTIHQDFCFFWETFQWYCMVAHPYHTAILPSCFIFHFMHRTETSFLNKLYVWVWRRQWSGWVAWMTAIYPSIINFHILLWFSSYFSFSWFNRTPSMNGLVVYLFVLRRLPYSAKLQSDLENMLLTFCNDSVKIFFICPTGCGWSYTDLCRSAT